MTDPGPPPAPQPLARASALLLAHAGAAALCLAWGLLRTLVGTVPASDAESGPGGPWLRAGALLLLLLPLTRNLAILWAARAPGRGRRLRAWLWVGLTLQTALYAWLLSGGGVR
jgi:drug/metabolite transporter (DMT)-like permease